MEVLLINPPADSPYPVMPLGIAYIASYLEKTGHNVKVIDAWAENLTPEETGIKAGELKPDVVGITVTTPLFESAMKTAQSVRANLSVPIIVGGPHPSALPEETLNRNAFIDFAVIGEGERIMDSLLEAIKKGGGYSEINGIAYRSEGKTVVNPLAGNPENPDDLPLPARHLFPLKKYNTHIPYGRKRPYMTIITSRGCPFSCKYCSKSVFGTRYRAFSPDKVVDEIEILVRDYGAKEIHFYDDVFTMNSKRAEAICDEIIRRRINVDWSCTTRVDLVNKHLLEKMKKSGCWLISYGVESGSEELLKGIHKDYTLEKVREIFRITKKTGIRTLGFFMIGLPGETSGTIEETIRLSLEINPDFVSWSIMTLLPGSIYYADFINDSVPAYGNMAEGEQIHKFAVSSGYHIYEGSLSKERLFKYCQEAHERFYLRPSYILRSLFKFRTLHEFSAFAQNGLQFVRDTLSRRS